MKLPYELLIGLRYTRSGRYDRFVSFVSLMSAAGIALGVAALVVVLAVMSGFHQELRGRILSVASHLEVLTLNDTGFPDWEAVSTDYLAHPEVVAAAPNIQEQALLIHGKQTQGALVRGIVPNLEQQVSQLDSYIQKGQIFDLQPGSFAVALGKIVASKLRVKLGDEIILVAPQGQLTAAGFYPRLRRLKVAAIFSSGLYQYDAGLAYLNMEDAKKIYRLTGATSIRLQLRELLQAPQLKHELGALRDDVFIHDWTSSHSGLFRALVLEKRVMFTIMVLIIAVAAFNIVSALVTMVRNKRGDIAILRAMGATRASIASIFLCQGLVIGLGGTGAGLLFGIPIAKNAGNIVNWVENVFGQTLFPASIYQLDKIPSIVSIGDSLLIAGVAVVLSLLATAYPAWYASRLQPAESLRYE